MTTVGPRNVSGKPVVVGVDGSANVGGAVAFAIDDAVMLRSSLRVIAAVRIAGTSPATSTMPAPPAGLESRPGGV